MAHRDNVYQGDHDGIVDRALWDRAQALIALNRRERTISTRAAEPSLLAGMITDGLGRPMAPTHATKGTRRYRYYQSRTDAGDDHRRWSLPAHPIEQLVVARLSAFVGEGHLLAERLDAPSSETLELLRDRSRLLAQRLAGATPAIARGLLTTLGVAVAMHDDHLALEIDASALLAMIVAGDAHWLRPTLLDHGSVKVRVPVRIKRRGQELRLAYAPGDPLSPPTTDATLIGLIVKAHRARLRLIAEAGAIPVGERPHLTRLARLTCLAPEIVTAIVEGRQPSELSARTLLRAASLPPSWEKQRNVLGFG